MHAKDYIMEKTLAYQYNYALSTIPEKGVMQQASWGADANTPLGALSLLIKQFREFSEAQFEAVRNATYSPHKSVPARFGYLAAFTVSAMTGVYMLDTLINASKGEPPPDPSNPAWVARGLARTGLFNIWGDLILGQVDGIQVSSGDWVAGPSTRSMDNVLRLMQNMNDGDKAAAIALDTLFTSTPYSNIWYIKPMLKWALINRLEETFKPDAARAREKRMQKQNEENVFDRNYLFEREFIVPPEDQIFPR
jgi:hypothetical protein